MAHTQNGFKQSGDYYEILNSHSNASYDELKQNYKQLILQFHPDKLKNQLGQKLAADEITEQLENSTINGHASSQPATDTSFVLINQAWNTLKDPIKRKQYDAELLMTKFQLHSNVYARITLADMDCETDTIEVEATAETPNEACANTALSNATITCYTYNCRCGGQYIVDESALSDCLRNESCDGYGAEAASIDINVVDERNCDKNTDNVADGSALAGIYKDVAEEVFVECNECSLVVILKPQAHK